MRKKKIPARIYKSLISSLTAGEQSFLSGTQKVEKGNWRAESARDLRMTTIRKKVRKSLPKNWRSYWMPNLDGTHILGVVNPKQVTFDLGANEEIGVE